jgi:UDP-N-acetylmuramate--alanine ligase
MSRHLHFMGAGGVGMCGLAEVLLASGVEVSGCDLVLSERTDRLSARGAAISEGHDPSHLNGVTTLVVTSAVDRQSPEVAAALEHQIPVARRSEIVGELMRGRTGVAVAGTHGKTTTTALIGHLFTEVGLDPTVLVGGHARFMEGHGRLGTGEILVTEADEYDRSFLDLGPDLAIITNLEPEHLDCYGDAEELRTAFASFANRCATTGAVIVSADDPGTRALRPLLRRRVVTFGFGEEAMLRAVDVRSDTNGSSFSVVAAGETLGPARLPLPGRHNIANALAALAAGLEQGVPFSRLAAALERFAGVVRRFQILGERNDVVVVDDYAHHPTELRSVLDAARQAFPNRRLVAVFQPHLFSRTRDFADDFADALMSAEVAFVLPIYPAREQPISGVTSRLVTDRAVHLGHPGVVCASGMDESLGLLDELTCPGDVVLTMGAGDVHRLAEMWLGRIEA